MQPYDPSRPCPKCEEVLGSVDWVILADGEEVLRRRCFRCKYAWNEAVLSVPSHTPGDQES